MSTSHRRHHSNGSKPTRSPFFIEEWDEYFLAVAQTIARKSKDPKCQVGAVIVSEDKLVLSTGFNGLARGVYDDEDLLADVEEKLNWICHAEANAVLNAARHGIALRGCSIFVTKFPCLGCCNAIAQAGITRIYTHDKKFWDDDPADKTHERKPRLLKEAGIQVDAPFHPRFSPSKQLTLDDVANGNANSNISKTRH